MKNWHIIGAVFAILLGTALHFTYEWSGNNIIVALFSATNESVWEHLKLLASPMIFFTLAEFIAYGKGYSGFALVKLISILAGMLIITAGFYFYTAIIGSNFLFIDISLFVIAVIAGYWLSYKLMRAKFFSGDLAMLIGFIGFILLIICFIIFTFNPPSVFIFKDPTKL